MEKEKEVEAEEDKVQITRDLLAMRKGAEESAKSLSRFNGQ